MEGESLTLIIFPDVSSCFTSKIKKQKMEEVQRERKLVHEEMVRKYPIIAYLYVDTLFILFIIATRNETILYKTMFSVRSSKHNF